MSTSLAALDALPSIVDFYADYWNKRPFLVRDAIDQAVMDGLITPDELAGRLCHINWGGREVRPALGWPDAPALLQTSPLST
jgi:ribosomal protein L16 Arg81 hydroxylase